MIAYSRAGVRQGWSDTYHVGARRAFQCRPQGHSVDFEEQQLPNHVGRQRTTTFHGPDLVQHFGKWLPVEAGRGGAHMSPRDLEWYLRGGTNRAEWSEIQALCFIHRSVAVATYDTLRAIRSYSHEHEGPRASSHILVFNYRFTTFLIHLGCLEP